MIKRAVITQAKRTPIGKRGGILRDIQPHELAAPLLQHLANGLEEKIEDIILGNVVGPGGNIARVAALDAGLPLSVPGITIDRQCSAGLETIPLPPTMPMMAYKWLAPPWELQHPIIHRKQKCIQHQRMYIDEVYRAIVEVTDQFQRQNLTFIKQTLYLYNRDGKLCFEGISDLILGGLS